MLNVVVNGSHKKSYNFPLRYFFKVVITPERLYKRQGTHIEILLDTSESMWTRELPPEYASYATNCYVVDGQEVCDFPEWVLEQAGPPRVQQALEALKRILFYIPPNNYVSIYTFSSEVEPLVVKSPPSFALAQLDEVQKGTQETNLYQALNSIDDADNIIVITDGTPTDPPSPVKRFSGRVIFVAVGKYYNEGVLKSLAEQTNGVLYHVDDLRELFEIFIRSVKDHIGAKGVRVYFSSELPVNLINYSGNPVNLGTLEGPVKVYGYIDLPPNFNGRVLKVKVKYVALDREGEVERELYVTPAEDKEEFMRGVDKDVLAEGNWYYHLRNLNEHNFDETIRVMQRVAETTRRLDLLEQTKELALSKGDTKRLYSQVTRKLRE